jgi:hypothetical protein
MKFWVYAGVLLFLLAGSPATMSAQTLSVFDGTTPVGLAPSSVYPVAGFEQYDNFSGTMTPIIPLRHIGGRGEAGFDLVWNLGQTWSRSILTRTPTLPGRKEGLPGLWEQEPSSAERDRRLSRAVVEEVL